MLMMVVREQSLNRGINAQRFSPFHLFSCVCSVKFLSPISAVVLRRALTCHFSPCLCFLNFPFGKPWGGNKGEETITSSVTGRKNLKDSISETKTEKIHYSVAGVARLFFGSASQNNLQADARSP